MLLDDEGLIFAEALVPAPRLVVVGAVDTADSLCRMTGALGWRTVVIDPRSAFATPERIPSADEIVVKWPEEGYDEIELRPEDHVVVLTHDPKLDDPAISGALRRGVGYVGALGSRRTQEKRRDRLRESGISDEQLSRVSGPVGLDLGAHTPEETAISILAEIIAVRAGRDGRAPARHEGPHPRRGRGRRGRRRGRALPLGTSAPARRAGGGCACPCGASRSARAGGRPSVRARLSASATSLT